MTRATVEGSRSHFRARQPGERSWGCALLVASLGAVAACGLDAHGTEFVAAGHQDPIDASAAPGRVDATNAEAAPRGPSGDGPGAWASASGAGQGPEDSVLLPPPDSSPEAASVGDSSLGDNLVVDAPPAPDAQATEMDALPEAAPGSSACDRDGDGHLAAGAPCFGDDCCDTDPNVHSGQTGYFTSPSQCGSYDYDCDGVAAPEYGVANCQWIGLGCTGDGFVAGTACGVAAAFSVCAPTGVLTCAASVGSLTQGCR